jgi:integrase
MIDSEHGAELLQFLQQPDHVPRFLRVDAVCPDREGVDNRKLSITRAHMGQRLSPYAAVVEGPRKAPPLKEAPGRTRFLSPEEIERLLDACTFDDARSELACGYVRPFILVALNTGMRRNEILGLSRRSVDWENRMVTLADTKNGDARHVYLNDAAVEALRSVPAKLGDDRFFPFRPWQMTMAVRRAIKRAGIDDFSLHDARHTICVISSDGRCSGARVTDLTRVQGRSHDNALQSLVRCLPAVSGQWCSAWQTSVDQSPEGPPSKRWWRTCSNDARIACLWALGFPWKTRLRG